MLNSETDSKGKQAPMVVLEGGMKDSLETTITGSGSVDVLAGMKKQRGDLTRTSHMFLWRVPTTVAAKLKVVQCISESVCPHG